ncbi:DUF1932 domain-containing protein [Brevundimonas sp.]|uniref:DUF1932 domain-containing protein n=1 Tax=Brevundimonas sp. TaxID=1871086 RepID=UPI003D135C41
MVQPSDMIAVIGFGEAGRTFATAAGWGERARVYDRLTDSSTTRHVKRADYAACGVIAADTSGQAIDGASIVLSLVTADQANAVAVEAVKAIDRGAWFLDLNSVAPETKRANARAIEAAGGHYVDVAVMSPVEPAALAVPMLVSGPRAEAAAEVLTSLGFSNVRVVGAQVGRASSIKMIRSVMIKGIEALSAECVLAASEAGVLDEVVASLDASWPGADWGRRTDYNLDRMMVHGARRAAEMEEVVRTLDDLGVGSSMSRGTVVRQGTIGTMGLTSPPEGLLAKIATVLDRRAKAA